MGKGSRSGLVGSRADESEKTSLFECDVGLGLKMQQPIPTPSFSASYELTSGGGGWPLFCNVSNQVACVSDIYNVNGAASLSGASVLPSTLHTFSSDISFRSSGYMGVGQGMAASGKVALTVSQCQELERQMIIYKYMMASTPVPPQLLLPITSPSHVPSSQSNTSGFDLRVSSGSDPEPWRCRRTDGKKWRCSRDVAPDQKYCERHAHKSRTRSRKLVENQSHKTTSNSGFHHHPLNKTTTTRPFQKPIPQFATLVSPASHDQARSIEWFMNDGTGTIPVPTRDQHWQQLMQPSSLRVGSKSTNTDQNKDASVLHQYYKAHQEPTNYIPYIDSGSGQRLKHQQLGDQCFSLLNPKFDCSLQGSSSADTAQATRHFIDALSTAEREDVNENSRKCTVSSSSRKPPLSSLTLSMSRENAIDEDYEHAQMVHGMMYSDSDGESGGILKSQWLNPVLWTDSPPGGPLGEALCLGIASTAKAASNVPSPHGYTNSNTTSSCSKSSGEDGSHALNFIG